MAQPGGLSMLAEGEGRPESTCAIHLPVCVENLLVAYKRKGRIQNYLMKSFY